jgi:hypothetical protein
MMTHSTPSARLLLPALILAGCTPHHPPVTTWLPKIAEITEARDLDRGRVLDVKERWRPQDSEYQRARNLYRVAQARYDGWFSELALYVGEGIQRDPRTDPRYQDLSDTAGRADNEFAEYVDSLTGRSKGVASFPTSLFDVGIKIWLELRQAADKGRKAAADTIIHLKWEPWESITAAPAAPEPKPKGSP